MSVKIYNAFKINNNLFSFYNILEKELVPQAKEWKKKKSLKFTIERATHLFDSKTMGLYESEEKNLLLESLASIRKQQKEIKNTNIRNPLVDFEINVGLYPVSNNIILFRLFTEYYNDVVPWLKASKTLVKLTEFDYWDNTDPPEDVPYKKWKARYKVWEPFFDGTKFYYDLSSNNETIWPIDHRKEIPQYIPSFKTRVHDMAMKLSYSKMENKQQENWLNHRDKVEKNAKSLYKKVESKLIKDIDYKILSGGW